MSCKYQNFNQFGDRSCKHPNGIGVCNSECGCPLRTDEPPCYNSSKNAWEVVKDGKIVEVETPSNSKTQKVMAEVEIKFPNDNSCKFCNFHSDDQKLIFDGQHNGLNIEACLISPSPISMRKNPDKPAQLQVVTEDEKHTFHKFEMAIAYCPICGRKL